MFGCRARPATRKTQPHLIVTAQSITPEEVVIMRYPAAGVLVLSVYVMVSMVTLVYSFMHTHSHTDGQDLGSSQAYCPGQIKAESILCSEFKQWHLCLTVKGIL